MASPQLEDGSTAYAHDLHLAILRADFSALEIRVIEAIAHMTYGVGKKKAEISTEDIRYLLGADKKLRTDRIDQVITELLTRKVLFRQELINGKQLLALQKDYDLWTDKMSLTLQDYKLININNPSKRVGDKMSLSIPEKLLDYAQSRSKYKLSIQQWRIERKYARQLYIEVLERTRAGEEAFQLITDYIDQNDWMRANVQLQFTYMANRFEAWRVQIPRKPKQVREDEEALGRRYRFNVKTKTWEAKIQ
jgi:phage replication O-like protein O